MRTYFTPFGWSEVLLTAVGILMSETTTDKNRQCVSRRYLLKSENLGCGFKK